MPLEIAHKCFDIQVGKMYSVAHAEVIYTIDDSVAGYVAIIPILHEDKFAPHVPEHYHIDGRFKQSIWAKNYFTIVDARSKYPVLINSRDEYFKINKIVFKNKKCIRLDTGLDLPKLSPGHDFIKWYNSMKGKSCKGKKCPHFGALMTEIHGQLVCPMHGLIGDIKTEKII